MTDKEETAIALASDQIINARDFCGDEREAAIEAIRNYGLRPTRRLVSMAFADANREWSRWQRQAGVTKPISQSERARIERVME